MNKKLKILSIGLIILASILTIETWAPGTYASAAEIRHPGLYARGSGIIGQYLSRPYVDGWNVEMGWQLLEPQESVYDWSEIDSALEEAKSYSISTGLPKRISVSIMRGTVPSWMLSLGISQIYLVDQNPNSDNFGQCVSIVTPWDSTYLSKRSAFLRAMGQHYTTERTDLLPYLSYMQGTSEAVTNGWGLPVTIYSDSACLIPTTWAALGYSSEKIIDGFKQLATAILDTFPDLPIWVAVGNIDASIDSNGSTYVAEQIAEWGFATYGERFGVWREDIGACIPNPPTSGFWKILWDHPGQNGAETLAAVSGDDGARVNKCGITDGQNVQPANGILADDVEMQVVQRGLDYGMKYIEFNGTDVQNPNLEAIFEYAHQTLTGTAPPADTTPPAAPTGLVVQ